MLVTLLGISIEVNPLQSQRADIPIDVTLLGITTEVKLLQSEKVKSLIVVTLLGIIIEVIFVQPVKAASSIVVTLLGMMMEVKLVHEKAYSPMAVTLFGMIIEVKLLLEKACAPMAVTLYSIPSKVIVEGIVIFSDVFPSAFPFTVAYAPFNEYLNPSTVTIVCALTLSIAIRYTSIHNALFIFCFIDNKFLVIHIVKFLDKEHWMMLCLLCHNDEADSSIPE